MSGWRPARNPGCLATIAVCASLAACAAVDASRLDEAYYRNLPTPDGEYVSLTAFRGKVLLVDIFTTWSQATVAAVPGYIALYEKYSEEGLAICGIALDEMGKKIVGPFVSGMQIPYPVLIADDSVKRGNSPLGDVSVYPRLMIFDRAGKLRKVFLGLVPLGQIEEVVKKLL